MKRIFFIISILFVASTVLSIEAGVRGDKEMSNKFAVASLAMVAGTAVYSMVPTLKVGFWGNAGLKTLERNADKFGLKTQTQMANIEAPDYTLYVRREITSKNGVYRLIEASNIKTLGVTNIDKNRLPEGDNLAIEAIWIAQGNHATVTDPSKIINYTNVASSVEAELRNGELVISQNTKEKLRLPISSLLAPAANSNGSKKDTSYSLRDNPVFLQENVPFEINIEFPAAVATQSTSTNKFHVEIELFSKKTQQRVA